MNQPDIRNIKGLFYFTITSVWVNHSITTTVRHKNRLYPYTAFNILQFGQNVQGKAIGLPSSPIPTIHEVPKGKHQAQHLHDPSATSQSLQSGRAEGRGKVKVNPRLV